MWTVNRLLHCMRSFTLLMLQTSRPNHNCYYSKVKYSYFWFPIVSFWSSKNETPNPKNRRWEGRWRIYLKFYIWLSPQIWYFCQFWLYCQILPFCQIWHLCQIWLLVKNDIFSNQHNFQIWYFDQKWLIFWSTTFSCEFDIFINIWWKYQKPSLSVPLKCNFWQISQC